MKEALELIPCEYCTVIIVDQENTEVYSHYTHNIVHMFLLVVLRIHLETFVGMIPCSDKN